MSADYKIVAIFAVVALLFYSSYLARGRARALRKLREAERDYRSIFANATTGIYQTTLDGRYVKANPMLAQMLGYASPEALISEVRGENSLERRFYVEPGRRAEFARLVEQHDALTGFESEVYRRDGSRIWVSEHALSIRDGAGKLVGFQGTTIEITDRKRVQEELTRAYDELELRVAQRTAELARSNEALRAEIAERRRFEDALRQSEEKFRTLVEFGSDWVWEMDEHAVYTYASPKIREMLGYEPTEIVGRRPYDLMTREEARRVATALQPFADRKEAFVLFENVNLRRDGSLVVTETSGVPILDDGGNFRGFRGIARDITERRRTEEQRARNEAKLRASREQLRALSAHLQTVREDERAFIAREIHDELGQTLTGLMFNLSWLGDRLAKVKDEPEQTVLFEKVQAMIRIVGMTMDTVRKIAAELRTGMLDELGLKAAVEWQAQEFEKHTSIHCRLTSSLGDMPLEQSMATAMFRILQESLTNVARHAQATEVRLWLGEREDHLVLEVEDDGRGIREQETSDPRALGILGMRERALLLGGSVSFGNVNGRGTRIVVSIPFDDATEA